MSRSTTDTAKRWGGRIAVPVGWILAGVLLLSTAAARWVQKGPGARLGGLELADNLRTGVISPSWGIWVAVIVYSIVGAGGALIATAAVRNRVVVLVRAGLCLLGLASFILLGWVVLPIDNWGAAPTIGSIAFLLATVLSAIQISTRR